VNLARNGKMAGFFLEIAVNLKRFEISCVDPHLLSNV
jgi:hypothetical protein